MPKTYLFMSDRDKAQRELFLLKTMQAIKKSPISQSEISEKVGLSRQTISKILNDPLSAKLGDLLRICDTVKIEIINF